MIFIILIFRIYFLIQAWFTYGIDVDKIFTYIEAGLIVMEKVSNVIAISFIQFLLKYLCSYLQTISFTLDSKFGRYKTAYSTDLDDYDDKWPARQILMNKIKKRLEVALQPKLIVVAKLILL